jgi:hypothetical protein
VDHALGLVQSAFGASAGATGPGEPEPGGPDDVMVVVSRRGAPLWRVVQEIETALDRS